MTVTAGTDVSCKAGIRICVLFILQNILYHPESVSGHARALPEKDADNPACALLQSQIFLLPHSAFQEQPHWPRAVCLNEPVHTDVPPSEAVPADFDKPVRHPQER